MMLDRIEQARQKSSIQLKQSAPIPDPVEWIEEHFYIPETDGPITLEPYQRAALTEALIRDESGNFKYSIIVWSDIKKSAKSTIAAAVALWMAEITPWATIRIVANDLKQADSRVSYYLRRALALNPIYHDTYSKRGYQITLSGGSRIEAVPIDPKGEAGGGDDMVCFSELWGANQKAAQQMWTETTLSPLKFGQSFRWVETYAGYEGEAPVLEQLYTQGVREGHMIDLGIDGLEVYANSAARLFCLWNTEPRCPWQTPEYYAQETAVLPPNEFARVHKNQWGTSTEAFIVPEHWHDCEGTLPKLDLREPIILGVDAATTGDCFAVVGVSRYPDKDRAKTDVAVRFCKVWYPPKGGEIDYSQPEKYMRDICKKYNVKQIAYDKHQLVDMMQRFRRDRVAHCKDFAQGVKRLSSDKMLYDLIMRKGIVHQRHDDLTEHILNANRKSDPETRKLRIVKRSPERKIDAAVALAMASYEALRLRLR